MLKEKRSQVSRFFQNNLAHILMVSFIVYSCIAGWSVYNTIVSSLLILVSVYRQHLEAHTQKTELQDKIKNMELAMNTSFKSVAQALEDQRKAHDDLKASLSKLNVTELKRSPMAAGYKF
jgi:predicted negative regulator of RcsB-dependent stress response